MSKLSASIAFLLVVVLVSSGGALAERKSVTPQTAAGEVAAEAKPDAAGANRAGSC